MLEKAAELSEVGAGIQLPPNASRVMADFDLMPKLKAAGCNSKNGNYVLRWQNGKEICCRPGDDWAKNKFGHNWHVMHRADYQRVLVDEARRLGTEIRLGQDVVSVDCRNEGPVVHLASGETVVGDVIIGADGLRSIVRTSILGYEKEPEESGDIAYRVTIPREDLEDEDDPFIKGLISNKINPIWWGENMHVVVYGVRNDKLLNVVLICPDDLPAEVSRQPGDLAEMNKLFEGWDPRLHVLLSKVQKALKWKVWKMDALDKWTKGSVALLGDACHPSVPYAASGAAMAVEDGAIIGRLLGLFDRAGCTKSSLPALMQVYQGLRKDRTTTIVKTADQNRELYHMVDGPEQTKRDRMMAAHDWSDENRSFPWVFADLAHLYKQYGFDWLRSADESFANSGLVPGS